MVPHRRKKNCRSLRCRKMPQPCTRQLKLCLSACDRHSM
jgi:hypothetical protein